MEVGICLGLETPSNAYRVWTANGSVVKAYTTKRMPLSEQWKPELIEKITG